MGGAAELVHATAIAAGGKAALIRGLSGSGKSDLALRCLALGPSSILPDCAVLVADDQVMLERWDGQVTVSCPPPIRGKLEVRGLGIVTVPSVAAARLTLIVDLVATDILERLPDPAPAAMLLGLEFTLLRLQAFEASAPAKLLLALAASLAEAG